MEEDEIWTEEENSTRELNNMIDNKSKSCKNCFYGGCENGEDFTTCGVHHQNFRITSMCAYWTDRNDEKLKAYKKRRKEYLIKKYLNNETNNTPILPMQIPFNKSRPI